MDNEVVNEVLDRIDSVGQAISEGAVAGFDVLLKQALLSGVGKTIAALFFFGLGAYLYRLVVRLESQTHDKMTAAFNGAVEKHKNGRDDWMLRFNARDLVEKYSIDYVKLNVAKGGAVFLGAWGIPFAVQAMYRFANPAYYAIQEVLRVFG